MTQHIRAPPAQRAIIGDFREMPPAPPAFVVECSANPSLSSIDFKWNIGPLCTSYFNGKEGQINHQKIRDFCKPLIKVIGIRVIRNQWMLNNYFTF